MAVTLNHASMLDWLAKYDGPLFDSCVTDPPYELGFMGKGWDSTGIAFQVETWRRVYDALKPGAHLVAFSGTRTYHRMACAIEDAGFEIRDQLAWTYGSGFPKSLDVSKAIDKAAGAEREVVGVRANGKSYAADAPPDSSGSHIWTGKLTSNKPATEAAKQWQGWGSALKPAWEPICLARKPLAEKNIAANVLTHGTGAINVDACRVGAGSELKSGAYTRAPDGVHQTGLAGSFVYDGSKGRFPANLLHDGSDEVLVGFPDCNGAVGMRQHGSGTNSVYGNFNRSGMSTGHGGDKDSGSAARFFYSAKAGPLDRLGTAHATVKPVDLMRWLCRLITPLGGHILEPFAGSGTTGIAAMAEGFDCTMIELEAEHVADIERKLAYLRGEGCAGIIERHKARIDRKPNGDLGPLFNA
jgi:site-specific DNA-methyltransferase (adenine-specific)